MTSFDPRIAFPDFYSNQAVQVIAGVCRWTISGNLGSDDDPNGGRKAPVDVRHILEGCNSGCRHTGQLRGAFALDQTCLLTLDELTRHIPTAANAAYYLQAQTDGLMIIDIEPDCPPHIATDLLRLPGILYSELSMSGRGFHLLVHVPENFYDFSVASSKRVLREEHGWYELLLDHWATFTRNPVPLSIRQHVNKAQSQPAFASVDELYADLAGKAKDNTLSSSAAISTDIDAPSIPHADQIVDYAVQNARGKLRLPEDFDNDMSRWEFSVLGSLYAWMQHRLASLALNGRSYSSSDVTWLLYRAAIELPIPHRPKHDEMRNGRPYLLDRAAALVAERVAAKQAGRM